MTRKYIKPFALLIITATACSWKGADQDGDTGQDTFIGDDGGSDGGETGFEEPPPIEDHGVGDYCVARAQSQVSDFGMGFDDDPFDINDVHSHERWHHSLQREYGGAFDFSGKPELNDTIPNILPAQGWPLTQVYLDDASERGGLASGLVSGYHLQLPFVGVSDVVDSTLWQLPYAVDIVAGAARPSQALRHSWASVGCCAALPLTDEEVADPAWSNVTQPGDFWPHVDCASYVLATGVAGDAAGFPRYPSVTEKDVAEAATCISGGGSYTPDSGIMEAISYLRGDPLMSPKMQPAFATKTQAPAIVNYNWIGKLATLVDWQAALVDAIQYVGLGVLLNKYNISVQAVAQSVLWVANNLVLPPDDFQHARYGIGGGCMFPVIIMYDPDTDSWWSTLTCPVGFYADVPTFAYNDEDVRSWGIGGTCKVDGVDGGAGLVDTGDILAPSPMGANTYYVNDLADFAGILTGVGTTVTPALADLISAADSARSEYYAEMGVEIGEPEVRSGDVIAWHSSPDGLPLPMNDAMLRSLGYDDQALDELAEILGWSAAQVREWIDEQPVGTLSVLLAERGVVLPKHLADRISVSLRRHHAWHLRIEVDADQDGIADSVRSLHFVG